MKNQREKKGPTESHKFLNIWSLYFADLMEWLLTTTSQDDVCIMLWNQGMKQKKIANKIPI